MEITKGVKIKAICPRCGQHFDIEQEENIEVEPEDYRQDRD